jgi:putative ATP-binding cassette transporter
LRWCDLNVLFNQLEQPLLQRAAGANQDVFTYQIGFFCVLATFWIALKVYQLYLNQWLQIRWRRWMTARISAAGCMTPITIGCSLKGDAADNPDQRIADDTKRFVEQTLRSPSALLSAVVTLASFVVILWGLSTEAPLHIVRPGIRDPRLSGMGRLDLCIFGTH